MAAEQARATAPAADAGSSPGLVCVGKADAGIASAVDSPAPRRAKRRLRDLRVTFVSLVRRGANGRAVIAKAGPSVPSGHLPHGVGEDGAVAGTERVVRLVKADAARRVVYGVVYAPDCVDSEGDTMTAEDIEAASYRFMKEALTGAVDRQHDETPIGGAYVAESWLVRKGDGLFPSEPVGTWAVGIKVEDEATWADVVAGEIGGLSMMGEAAVEELGTTDDGPRTTAKADATDSNEAQEAPQGMNTTQTARGTDDTTVLDRVRKALGLATSAEADGDLETTEVAKDYAGKRLAAQIQANTWTLGEAIREALGEDEADAGAVLASIDQFRAETAALLGVEEAGKAATPKKPKNVWRLEKDSEEEAADDEAHAVPSTGSGTPVSVSFDEPQGKGSVTDSSTGSETGAAAAAGVESAAGEGVTLAALAKSVEALSAQLDALSSQSAGRQSVDTRDVPVVKGKSFKGLRIV